MSLDRYGNKRDFARTTEPKSGQPKRAPRGADHPFVVQRHHASRVHYDFRLEIDGTLKSWAVPKGPSMNPVDKRFAVRVEDHPLDYQNFEGEIAKGNYGAGHVHLWDRGTFELLPPTTPHDRGGLEQIAKGSLRVELRGKKLKGVFALVRMRGAEQDAWLLVKQKDKHAVDTPYVAEDLMPKRALAAAAKVKAAHAGGNSATTRRKTAKKSARSTRSAR